MPLALTVTLPCAGFVVFAKVNAPPDVVESLPATLSLSVVSSFVLKLSFCAARSATELMARVTVAMLLLALPSLAWKVKLSAPWKLALGE